jgi:hypothetical protein
LSRPPDAKVAYFCNNLQTNTICVIAEKNAKKFFFRENESELHGARI